MKTGANISMELGQLNFIHKIKAERKCGTSEAVSAIIRFVQAREKEFLDEK